jgi:ERCC4-type nuclease
MKIVIDYRENKLIRALNSLFEVNEKLKDIIILNENLEIGDIIIKDDNDNIKIIIERKTIDDLLSSIKDGRYSEQSLRLNSVEHHNHNIIYLIEGNIGFNNKQMIYSSIFSLNYYKGFSVYRSLSIEETAYIIANSALKLKKEKDKKAYYNNKTLKNEDSETNDGTEENTKEEKSYTSIIKKKKSDNITEENFGEIVLIQIPGISNITASAIIKEYKTINNLIDALKENKDVLNSFSYENDKKQKRKLNKTCIANILKFLIQ